MTPPSATTSPAAPLASAATGTPQAVHQRIPWAGHVNYAAAKGGVRMLMETMAQELAGQAIRVNAIAPGAIKTPIHTEAWATPAAARKLLKLIPYAGSAKWKTSRKAPFGWRRTPPTMWWERRCSSAAG